MKRLDDARILMYSHDTFGLGHLRRCRTIAHALVEQFKGVSVLIISGSQIAGAFDFRARVDFVKIPSVIKLYSGDYTSISDHIDIEDILTMREAIIRSTAEIFDPDIFIVDKEPMGLRGEVEPVLRLLKERGTRLILGLRDVMDSPELLESEWEKKNVIDRIEELYDHIWVYGPRDFWNPLNGLPLPANLTRKIECTGFLRRETSSTDHLNELELPDDYVLVTAGGGGDGADIMRYVLSAVENDPTLIHNFVLVLGPFMRAEFREELYRRADALKTVTIIDFDNDMEAIMAGASAVVGMCGYNTFCEIISFDKPSLFVPRTRPREEQLIRATRAQELELSRMLDSDNAEDPQKMAEELKLLPQRNRPSSADWTIDLSGLESICARVETILDQATTPETQDA
ncbi:MAG: glycosyltransferase [Pseudomonadota bacterium]